MHSSLLKLSLLVGLFFLGSNVVQAQQLDRYNSELQNARLLRLTEKFTQAERALDSAAYYLRRKYGSSHRKAGFLMVERSRLLLAQYKFDLALQSVQTGLNRFKPSSSGNSLGFNPVPGHVFHDKEILEGLLLKAEIYLAYSKEVAYPKEMISSGLAATESALEWFEFLLDQYRWQDDYSRAGDILNQLFSISFRLIQAQTDADEVADRALVIDWTSKFFQVKNCLRFRVQGMTNSLLLTDSLNKLRIKSIEDLLENRILYEDLVKKKGEGNLEAIILKENIEMAYDSLRFRLNKLRQLDSNFFNISDPSWLTNNAEKRYLTCQDNSDVLQYIEIDGELFAFFFSKDIALQWTLQEAEYESSLERLLEQVSNPPSDSASAKAYAKLAFGVYKSLFGPVVEHNYNKDLWIGCYGKINKLPFEALVYKYGKNEQFSDLSFLVEAKRIRYFQQWSAFCERRDYSLAATKFFALSEPKCIENWDIEKLSSFKEIQRDTIKIEPGWVLDGYLSRSQWSEPGVNLSRDSLIKVCSYSPFIILTSPLNYASLQANLQNFYVGSSYNILFNKWSVCKNQQAYKVLHKQLERGAGKLKSVRNTKLELINKEEWSHPYYWAGLSYYGDDVPLRKKHKAGIGLSFGLSIGMLILLVVWLVLFQIRKPS